MAETDQIFPITGNLADIALGLEAILIFICFEMLIFFIFRYRNNLQKEQNGRNLSWSVFFLGYAFTYIFYILADYFPRETAERDLLTQYGYLCLSLGLLMFIGISEHTEKRKYRPFTLVMVFFFILVIVTLLLDKRETAIMITTVTGFPITFIFSVSYFRKLANITNFNRAVLKKIIGIFVSFLFITAGYFCVSDMFVESYGASIRIIGAILNIIGINFFMLMMVKLPDYREFVWKEKLNAVFIIDEAGLCVFNRFFKGNIENDGKELMIAGALTGIKAMLSNMTSKSVKVLELSDKVLIFDHIEEYNIIACIIADEYLDSFEYRIKSFLADFMKIFGTNLKKWKGNIDFFMPLESICDEIFMPLQKND
jgi:hypothetical protein